MSQSHPRVTVIIPCYNRARWVGQAVTSALSQDYPCRVVVIDDGSSDGSADAVPKRPEVTVLRLETPHGPSFARNHGIRDTFGTTEVFAFLDSDDFYRPGKISKSVAKLADGVAVVYSDYDTLREDGLLQREWKEPFSRARLFRECVVSSHALVTKRALEVCGFFDEDLRVCEDYDLWLRLSNKFAVEHIPESLVTMRVGSHDSTATVKKEVWEASWRRVREKWLADDA